MFSHGTAGSGSAAFLPSRYALFAVIPEAFAVIPEAFVAVLRRRGDDGGRIVNSAKKVIFVSNSNHYNNTMKTNSIVL